MKKLVALMLTLAMILSCSLPALAEETTSIAVCLASEPDTIDPALNSAVDGATLIAHLFSGLATWAQKDDDLQSAVVLLTEYLLLFIHPQSPRPLFS